MDKKFWNSAFEYENNMTYKNQIRFIEELRKLEIYILLDFNKNLIAEVREDNSRYIMTYTNKNICDKLIKRATNFDTIKYLILKKSNKLDGIVLVGDNNRISLDFSTIREIENITTGMTLSETKGIKRELEYKEADILPKDLVKNIRNFISEDKSIKQINLYKAKDKKAEEYHWIFLIVLIDREIDVFPRLARVIQRSMSVGEKFELVKVDSKNPMLKNYRTIIYKN